MPTVTYNVPAGGTVTDLFSFLLTSVPTNLTPAHRIVVQNNGTGTLRVGDLADINTNFGLTVGPGEIFALDVGFGNRIGFVGDGGAAAPSINFLLQIGGC